MTLSSNCVQVVVVVTVLAAPTLGAPFISPSKLLETLSNIASKIGRRRNAQLSSYGGAQGGFGGGGGSSFVSSSSFEPSSIGGSFSDGTNFGQTFADFGASSSSSSGFDGASCSTSYEEQCTTVTEQQCNTVNEQQCRYNGE